MAYGIYNKENATINVYNCDIKASTCIYNETSGNIIVQSTALNINEFYNTIGIFNKANGNVLFLDGTIDAKDSRSGSGCTGICNNSNGTVVMEGGKIKQSSKISYGISNVSNGTIIIGKNDGKVSKEIPEIYGSKAGIDSNGTLNIYDGSISGAVAINGTVSNIEESYEIIKEIKNSVETAYLDKLPIVSIGDVEYYSIKDAVDSVKENNEEPTTIFLLRNATILENETSVVIPVNKNIIMSLNGYKITTGNDSFIKNYGTLKVSDDFKTNANSGTGKIDIQGNSGIENHGKIEFFGDIKITSKTNNINNIEGKCIINGASLEVTTDNSKCISNSAEILFQAGKIILNKPYGSKNVYGIYNTGSTLVTINGGIITDYSGIFGISYGIWNNDDGIITLNSGEIKSKYNIYNNGSGVININGGALDNFSEYLSYFTYGIYNASTGTVNFTNGNINIQSSSYGTQYGIYNNLGKVTIYSGNISIKATLESYGIYNNEGEIDLKDGKIISNGGTNSYGIYNNKGNIYIDKADINSNLYGIYGNDQNTQISFGMKDNKMDIEAINVEAIKYGIYTEGSIRFYDGKVNGNIAVTGKIEEVENGFYLETQKEVNKEISYLKTFRPEAKIGEVEYNKLEDAINSVDINRSEVTQIDILRNINTVEENISESKKIILNLNGFNIVTGGDNGINNNGNLKIINQNTMPNKIEIKNTEIINNGDYFFTDDGNGSLIPSNSGISVISKAQSYFKIDLSKYSGEYKLKINAEISTSTNNYGYAIISNSIESPSLTDTTNRIISLSGKSSYDKDYMTTILGGKVYYLHFIYSKNSTAITNDDKFIINNIEIKKYNYVSNFKNTCIKNNNDLEISDNIELKSISQANCINNNGELTINNLFIFNDIAGISSTNKKVIINNLGKLKINNIYLYNSQSNVYAIFNQGELSINGGKIKSVLTENSNNLLIYNKSGKILITNGNLEALSETSNAIESYIIYNVEKADIEIRGGKLRSFIKENGNYYVKSCGIYSTNNQSTFSMDGGEVTSEVISNSKNYNISYGIAIDNANVNIKNGKIIAKINSDNNATAYGIIAHYSKLYIENGEIIGENVSSAENKLGVGIYNDGTNSIINLGINDSMVNINVPVIFGTTCGVSYASSTKFNFYDGKITGFTTIKGVISEVAPGYEINKTTNSDGTFTDILVLSGDSSGVCVMNSITYNNLSEAISAVPTGVSTVISLIKEVQINSQIAIPSGKEIVLSINGFSIYYNGENAMFENNGNLIIKDTNTSVSGNIINENGPIVNNNGTLTVGEDDSEISSRSPHIIGNGNAIVNSGVINFYDGNIQSTIPIAGTPISNIPNDYQIISTTNTQTGVVTMELTGIAPVIEYKIETLSEGKKIIVTAKDTNLSKVINPDNSEITGQDTQIISEYIIQESGTYTFKAIDKNGNTTNLNVNVTI